MPKARETKAYIIERTAGLFNTKGFVGTTLSDMEEATGLTKGSIYNNFANKDEVALSVFDYNLKKVATIIQSEVSRHKTAKDQILAYAKVYSANISKSPFPVGGCPILNTAIESDDTHPALRKKAAKAILDWKNDLVSILQNGIKNKEFKSTVDAEEVALTMLATIEGAVMISRVTGKPEYMRIIIQSLEKTIKSLT